MARQRIAIAGAGVLGRLLAWTLARAGHAVQVVDPAPGPEPRHDGLGAAGFTAAGMLSPLAEAEVAGFEIAALGWRSLALWDGVAQALADAGHAADAGALVARRGSLLLAHPGDRGAAQRVLARLAEAPAHGLPAPRSLAAGELAGAEPALSPGLLAWSLDGEGQVISPAMLAALCAGSPGVQWHWGRQALQVEPGRVVLDGGEVLAADWAIDTRGLGAKDAMPLRGVRGELLWLHAPGVRLGRPLRLLHPRHRVYIVPRPGERVVIGASEIESEDRSGVSLASAVELLSAARSVIPALAEARIVHLETNLRPALPDHQPRVEHRPGLLRINGLFRHGWLLAPALVDDALRNLELA
jgi:glycine oxidase